MTIEEVSKLKLVDVKKSVHLQRELQKVYRQLFNEQLTITCGNCIDDALFRINYIIKKQKIKVMETTNSKFKFFKNVVLYVPKFHTHFTNDNLTDAVAIALLRLTKANIKHFEVYPPNWLDFVTNEKPVVNVDVNDEKVVETEKPVEEEIVEEEINTEEETEEEVSKPVVFTVDDIIRDHKKSDIIQMLVDKGYQVDEGTSATKAELAAKLVTILNKQ